jgi:hypothetical protein
MNFARDFGRLLFEPGAGDPTVLHHGGILLSTVFAVCALLLCVLPVPRELVGLPGQSAAAIDKVSFSTGDEP